MNSNSKQASKQANCSDSGFECQPYICNSDSQLYNGKGEQGNLQCSGSRKRCCYCNYIKIGKKDVDVAMTILARDYKGFGSGLICSNGVIEIE